MYKRKKFKSRPGWNEYVEEYHSVDREALKLWIEEGKRRSDTIHDMKKRTSARFKYAVRFIKNHENEIKHEQLAKNLCLNDCKGFWKEIKYE